MNISQYQRQFIYSCEKCGKRYELFSPPSKTGFRCVCGGEMLPPTKEYIMNGFAIFATTTEEVEEQ